MNIQLRLTFNYWRKGGYSIGSEDYRWYGTSIDHLLEINWRICRDVLREKISPTLFFLFNVAFISLAQSILLFLISTPAYVMLLVSRFSESMTTADTIFARILMGLVMVEFFADQQQWGKYLFDNIYRYTV
jgi:steroid 5-alpha reductase family enzyme